MNMFNRSVTFCLTGLAFLSACTAETKGNTSEMTTKAVKKGSVTLVTYDSFALSKTVIAKFETQSGYKLNIVTAGDTGEMVNKSLLTRDAPLGDVMWGIDNTFASRATEAKLFEPLDLNTWNATTQSLISDLVKSAPKEQLVPMNYSDVCVNTDKSKFTGPTSAPESFDDLLKPQYRSMLVVENPATSSTGLAFLLGTIVDYQSKHPSQNPDGWTKYWQALSKNGLKIVDTWTQAYETDFSQGGGAGKFALVVSYATSPAAAVLFSDNPDAQVSPIGTALGTCFRQIEYAGILHGAKNPDGAKALLKFLVSDDVQTDMQLKMFVFPASRTSAIVAPLTKFADLPVDVHHMTPQDISKNRDRWIELWESTVL